MSYRITPITAAERAAALALRDLSDPTAGAHCMQRLVADAADALTSRWRCDALLWRGERVVDVADNYDRLGYPADGPARDARYTRYVDAQHVLRTQTSAAVPGALRHLAAAAPDDLLIYVPGLVYRRDAIGPLHVGEPHQLDLWRVTSTPMTIADLHAMVDTVVGTLTPGAPWRAMAAEHPYTTCGIEVEVRLGERWVELLECGLAHPRVLAGGGLGSHHGLAMGIGLDRAVMARKGVSDIRSLRCEDPRVASQMLDLAPYRPVSDQPAVRGDLSVACPPGVDDEMLGDRVRRALGAAQVNWVEEVTVLSRTPACRLPRSARTRMGLADGHENLLVRVTLRHPTRSLPRTEANRLRDRIYAAIHEGVAYEWASRG
jgi:phenylalanyl-tRNA synthetase alpha chain